jgi:hypothetical protein
MGLNEKKSLEGTGSEVVGRMPRTKFLMGSPISVMDGSLVAMRGQSRRFTLSTLSQVNSFFSMNVQELGMLSPFAR